MASLPPEVRAHLIKLARKGGNARAKSLTPARRVEIAKKARAVGIANQQQRKKEEEQA